MTFFRCTVCPVREFEMWLYTKDTVVDKKLNKFISPDGKNNSQGPWWCLVGSYRWKVDFVNGIILSKKRKLWVANITSDESLWIILTLFHHNKFPFYFLSQFLQELAMNQVTLCYMTNKNSSLIVRISHNPRNRHRCPVQKSSACGRCNWGSVWQAPVVLPAGHVSVHPMLFRLWATFPHQCWNSPWREFAVISAVTPSTVPPAQAHMCPSWAVLQFPELGGLSQGVGRGHAASSQC